MSYSASILPYILHFSHLYQTVSLACLGVELARMAIRNRKPDRSGCKTGFIYIMVSLLVPALIVAPTVLTYSINRSLVQYGVTLKNTLQCWINNPTALITSSALPSLLALVCCYTGLGMGLLLTLSKQFRSAMRRYLPLSIGSDSHSQQRMPLTRYLLLALAIAVCAVCSLLAIIFILHLVLTDLDAHSHHRIPPTGERHSYCSSRSIQQEDSHSNKNFLQKRPRWSR